MLLRTGAPPGAALALLLAVTVGGLTAGCAGSEAATSDRAITVVDDGRGSSPYTGVVLDQPYPKPAVTLVDTQSRPFSLARDTTAPVTLVFFGFTSCTDECPAMLANVAVALDGLDPAVRDRIQVLFITSDPARDSPRAMRRFLDRFDPSFEGLTGKPAELERVAADLGIALTGVTRLPGGGYDVGHSSQLIGFAPDGRARVVWPPDDVTVPGLREDLRMLVEARHLPPVHSAAGDRQGSP